MKRTILVLLGLVAGLILIATLTGGGMSPAKSAAYDLVQKVDKMCEEAMADAAPGADKRRTRLMCEQMKADADRRYREAR